MLDQYQLLDRIGVGGMAEVWKANMRGAEGFERPVAIKRILPQFSGDEDFVAMFVDEAKIAVRLSHPNIVQIFDLGRAGDEWFIAMEFVHGKDLRAVADAEAARGQRVPLEVACHSIMKMCEALHHAHFLDANPLEPTSGARQVIHRDVSPQNVLVSFDGEVKVTDFGLAKAAGRAAQTQAGTIKGKLAYMSPEQLRGTPLDQRSDVFAVGIVLWELLSGERLFLGQNDRDTIAKAFACKVPPLTGIDPSLDPELDRITLRALALDRNVRYQTAQELHEDLEAFVYGSGLTLSTGSLSAYMRALFPQADVERSRKRDPRMVTAQIQLTSEVDELDADDLIESEEPAPRTRSVVPGSSIPLSASDMPSELSDHDIDALEESIQAILGAENPEASKSALSAPRLPSIPVAAGASVTAAPPARTAGTAAGIPDATNETMLSDPDAVYPELDAARRAYEAALAGRPPPPGAPPPSPSLSTADEHDSVEDEMSFDDPSYNEGTLAFEGKAPIPESTLDDPEATVMPSDDEAYAAMAGENPSEELLITRMVGPAPTDLAASRQRDADASAVASKKKLDERPAYVGFDDEDETTTGHGQPKRR